MVKHLTSLRPSDSAGEEMLRNIKHGELVSIEVRRPRNVYHHRKFFALLNIVFENQEKYQTVEQLLTMFKIATGHCETMETPKGTIYIPKSIAFHKMDQDEFSLFWDKCIKLVVTRILPGITKEDLERELLEIIG